jgi:hypothetical protein
MIGMRAMIAGLLVAGFASTASPQSGPFGGPVPVPTDDNRAQIETAYQRALTNARALGLTAPPNQQIVPPAARGSFKKIDFPLRLMPNSRNARPNGIGNFVDRDNTSNIKDFACGTRTYDGHRGTDLFLLPFGWSTMDNQEAEIIAAAPGTIVDKNDGEFDRQCTLNGDPANYVIVLQDDGAYALYWHMKSGTPTTKAIGQTVVKGEHLGFVGSSGSSTNPHLHFEMRDGSLNGTTVDPFAGTCGDATTLWKHQWSAPLDDRLVLLGTSNAPPELPDRCTLADNPHLSNTFQPGAAFYPLIGLRDQTPTDVVTATVFRPDGTTFFTSQSGVPPTLFQSASWYWTLNLPANAPTGAWKVRAVLGSQQLEHAFYVGTPPAAASLVAAVLPSSRSVQAGSTATVFSSIINFGSATAFGLLDRGGNAVRRHVLISDRRPPD